MTDSGERKESQAKTLENLAEAVDQALEGVKDLDEVARAKAMRLKEALEAFHKDGLVQLVKTVKSDPRGKELLLEAMAIPSVYALFSMHGIIKPPIFARVLEVLEQVRPYVASHGGDIELVSVEEGVAYVRLHGACAGCSMSSQTLRDGVEEAICKRLPEISRVEQVQDIAVSGFLQIENARGNRPADIREAGWVEGPLLNEISGGGVFHMASIDVIVTKQDGKLFAYRNACPHMGQPLHDGRVTEDCLTCPAHGFKFMLATGECITAPQVQLEPFPLKIVEGRVWVRPA